MDRYIIDERNGFEYELKGDYYPTGRRIVDGVPPPDEIPEDDEPDAECRIGIWGCGCPVDISAGTAEAPTEAAAETNGTCDISGNTKRSCVLICMCPEN